MSQELLRVEQSIPPYIKSEVLSERYLEIQNSRVMVLAV